MFQVDRIDRWLSRYANTGQNTAYRSTQPPGGSMSEIHKFTGSKNKFYWSGVKGLPLEIEGIQSATKHVLIGEKEGAPNSIMRFFDLAPGGHSKLERHSQEHEVLVIQGKGKVRIGEEEFTVSPFDAVFVEGDELHQFTNPFDEPFGFICVIPKMT
jgi:quercetin dioxygenase-like cupin family protein